MDIVLPTEHTIELVNLHYYFIIFLRIRFISKLTDKAPRKHVHFKKISQITKGSAVHDQGHQLKK